MVFTASVCIVVVVVVVVAWGVARAGRACVGADKWAANGP